jgi:hypothetical protein
VWTGLIWPWMDPAADPCEHGTQSSDSINGGEFIAQLSDLASEEGLCTVELRV